MIWPWRQENKITTDKKRAASYPSERQKFRMHEDLLKLKYAIEDAENIYQYTRENLHRIFREIMKDPHLRSQWQTRKMKTIEKEFSVCNEGDVEDDALTALLTTQWFLDLTNHILDSKLWGFSLIEFGPVQDNKFVHYKAENNKIYPGVNLIDRDYVKPEFGVITKETVGITGLSFYDPKYEDQLLFVGEPHDHGLLLSAVKYILFKDNCIANWSEWAEIFGMDVRIGKTMAEGTDRQKFLDTLKNLGSSGYGVIDKEDELEFFGTARNDAFKVYQELNNYVDVQISKLIFGQDVVTNNTGRVVGSVGENISNLYGDADAKFLERIINDQVFPRLTALGIGNFEGKYFKWDTSEKVTLLDNATIDEKIAKMGFQIEPKYIEEKYGTKLDPTEPIKAIPEKTATTAYLLKQLYGED